MQLSITSLGRACLVVGLGAASMGAGNCNQSGDRAGNPAVCPDDAEQPCSDKAPKGLTFIYPHVEGTLGNSGELPPLALGGRMTLQLRNVDKNALLTEAFASVSSTTHITAAPDPNRLATVVLTSDQSPALGTLKIVENDPINFPPGGDPAPLMDQTEISSAKATVIRVREAAPGEGNESPQSYPPVLWASSPPTLAIELLDSQQHRLVNEALTVSASPPVTAVRDPNKWDRFTLDLSATPPTSVALRIVSGAEQRDLTLDRVNVVDDLRMTKVGDASSNQYCFEAISRAGAANRRILGLTWTFTPSGVEGFQSFTASCYLITQFLSGSGAKTITAQAGGKSAVFNVMANAAPSSASTTAAPPTEADSDASTDATGAALLGDRARQAAGTAPYVSSPVQ